MCLSQFTDYLLCRNHFLMQAIQHTTKKLLCILLATLGSKVNSTLTHVSECILGVCNLRYNFLRIALHMVT